MNDPNEDERRIRAAALDKLIRESKPRPLTAEQRKLGSMYERLRARAKRLAQR